MDLCILLKNIRKNLSNNYGQNFLDSAKRSTTDAIKTVSKIEIPKTENAADDLIGNKSADKITSISKKSLKERHSQNKDEIEIPKERNISQKKTTNYSRIKTSTIIIMIEFQKLINVPDNTLNEMSKFTTKNHTEIKDQSKGVYNTNSDIRFKTTMLKSSLCYFSDTYIKEQ